MRPSRLFRLSLFALLILVYGRASAQAPGQVSAAAAAAEPARQAIVGDALLTEGAYHLLDSLTTRFGPRMAGTEGNRRSMDALEDALRALGLQTRREPFSYPGWRRGDDRVEVASPFTRPLRAVALGYSPSHAAFEAPLVYVARADDAMGDLESLRGAVLLLAPNLTFSNADQQTLASAGVRGLLLINRVGDGQLLARVANQNGDAAPFPLYSITQEEGFWLQRLLGSEPVRVRLTTRSQPYAAQGVNLVATLPGTSGQKVVVGAHFDSWDLGQGALDNGLGVAQLYEAARLLSRHSPGLHHTVEFVWFDAEELGLWGSRRYVERGGLDSVRVMLNLDMVGEPIGLNAMGFSELTPLLERAAEGLGVWDLTQPLANKTWLGSDHHPFVASGIPAVTFNAPINPEAVRFYHDFGDTFDKVDRAMLARASAVVALVTRTLARDTTTNLRRYSPAETADLLRAAGVEDRLRSLGQWPFGD
ncbi:MAG: M28 family peptidase [Rhodothermales bacterium]